MTSVAIPNASTTTFAEHKKRLPHLGVGTWFVFVLVALIGFIAIFGGTIAPHSETAGNVSERLLSVGEKGHLLGTDGQGRDMFSRLLYGMRISLFTGLLPVLIAGTVGTMVGVGAGMGSRRVNALIMRTLDVFYSFPSILLAIGIAAALGPSIKNAIIALSVVLIPPVARIAEADVIQLRNADFMRAARCSGATRLAIAYRHVLPNIRASLLVYCTTLVGLSIVEAAGLSFLGLGAAPPHAEWGLMLNEGRTYFFQAPGVALTPALAIFFVALVFNALGERLRVELNVRDQGVHG
jgi:peptide/nickel transport system permease protein